MDDIMKTDVDEDQIEPYMAEINRQFEYIDKEDIIKKMVTITFGKFLDYYKNAPEIIMRLRLVSSACSSTWVRLMVSIRAKSCSI